jgi:hypothetical protein
VFAQTGGKDGLGQLNFVDFELPRGVIFLTDGLFSVTSRVRLEISCFPGGVAYGALRRARCISAA